MAPTFCVLDTCCNSTWQTQRTERARSICSIYRSLLYIPLSDTRTRLNVYAKVLRPIKYCAEWQLLQVCFMTQWYLKTTSSCIQIWSKQSLIYNKRYDANNRTAETSKFNSKSLALYPIAFTTHLHVPMVMRGLTLTVPILVNPVALLHIYMNMIMRRLTLTVPSLVKPIDLLHIYMPMVRIGLTLTVPSLVRPIDLLHIYMPMVMRGLTLTVPSLVKPLSHYTSTCLW